MNFEKILDISTPFNEEKLALFDQIVMIFYTTKSNEEVKECIFDIIYCIF